MAPNVNMMPTLQSERHPAIFQSSSINIPRIANSPQMSYCGRDSQSRKAQQCYQSNRSKRNASYQQRGNCNRYSPRPVQSTNYYKAKAPCQKPVNGSGVNGTLTCAEIEAARSSQAPTLKAPLTCAEVEEIEKNKNASKSLQNLKPVGGSVIPLSESIANLSFSSNGTLSSVDSGISLGTNSEMDAQSVCSSEGSVSDSDSLLEMVFDSTVRQNRTPSECDFIASPEQVSKTLIFTNSASTQKFPNLITDVNLKPLAKSAPPTPLLKAPSIPTPVFCSTPLTKSIGANEGQNLLDALLGSSVGRTKTALPHVAKPRASCSLNFSKSSPPSRANTTSPTLPREFLKTEEKNTTDALDLVSCGLPTAFYSNKMHGSNSKKKIWYTSGKGVANLESAMPDVAFSPPVALDLPPPPVEWKKSCHVSGVLDSRKEIARPIRVH